MVKEPSKSDDWYFDSSATAHMTKNAKDLRNRKKPEHGVKCANNERLAINSIGQVKQMIENHGQVSEIKLEEVLYIPDICENLLSVF